jgi:hypothetical protein
MIGRTGIKMSSRSHNEKTQPNKKEIIYQLCRVSQAVM